MIEYAVKAPIESNNNTYLQHGDINIGNAIWSSDENPVFIDIDNAGYLPILFDVIHFAAPIMDIKELLFTLNENQILLHSLLKRFGLDFCEASLDKVFFDYIEWYKKNCPELEGDYIF